MSDFRQAVRALRAAPLISAVAILSLALGVGANTAMFSIVDSLIMRDLPVPHAERLAIVGDRGSWTNPIWEQIRAHEQLFDGAFAWASMRFNLAQGGEADLVDGLWASGRFFDVLGVPAVLGRTFSAEDDRRGGGPGGAVAVISYGYWQRRYGGAASAIGSSITLNGVVFTIVGVTPPEFFGPEVGRTFDVMVPLGSEPLVRKAESYLDRRSTWWLEIMVRRKPDQSLAAATAALRSVQPRIREATLPDNWRPQDLDSYLARPLEMQPASRGESYLRQRYQRPLVTIAVVVALVLLIACGNIANLMLARATARRHEWSVRRALGASRLRLTRQLLAESALLAAAGAAAGVAIAWWGSRFLIAQLSTPSSRVFLDVGLDWRIFGFTALVALVTVVLFGVAPALRASRAQPIEAMREHGRGTSSDRRRTLGTWLVVAQVALSLVLVIGAGLFVRTFATLAHLDLGFDANRLLLVGVGAQRAGLDTLARPAFFERVRQAAAAVPGVASVAVSVITPVSGSTWNQGAEVVGGIALPEDKRVTDINIVSPGWFATMGVQIRAGRAVGEQDAPGTPHVAVVNQAFVKQFIGEGNPIGRVIREEGRPGLPIREITIVGLVGDAAYRSLREVKPPTAYFPMAQRTDLPSSASLIVRSRGNAPAALTRALVTAIGGVRPDLTLTFRTLESQIDASIAQERIVALLSAFFGALALLLAGLGLYGVTAYSVSRRRAELGIRMALGTPPMGVVRLVLRRVAGQLVAGVALGALSSWWAARFVRSLLYGLEPQDPVTIGLAVLVLATVGGLAGWLPARRAARIDPAVVLRDG